MFPECEVGLDALLSIGPFGLQRASIEKSGQKGASLLAAVHIGPAAE
jgi:hypothetical protein